LSLAKTEKRIGRHFESLCGDRVQVPSLMLVQAPTFHAHTFSIYIQFGREMDAANVVKAIAGDHVTVLGPGEDGPSNISAAGQGTVMVSVRPDAASAKGVWVWAAADNLKISAMTAVECASTLSTMRPLGKVQ
jgi:aspartate-semialdehyde dehydrogenase